jgi:fatty-acyl-CoA synthase
MAITVMRKAEHDVDDPRRLASCGRPVPWVHVELLDPNNCPVPDGEPGEICVRGPLVMDGYRNNPELTARTFAGGWALTLGSMTFRHSGEASASRKGCAITSTASGSNIIQTRHVGRSGGA